MANQEKLGIMICGHGSRNQNAMKEFASVSEGLKGRFGDAPVEYGYLEFANPVITHGLDKLRDVLTDVLARDQPSLRRRRARRDPDEQLLSSEQGSADCRGLARHLAARALALPAPSAGPIHAKKGCDTVGAMRGPERGGGSDAAAS